MSGETGRVGVSVTSESSLGVPANVDDSVVTSPPRAASVAGVAGTFHTAVIALEGHGWRCQEGEDSS